MNNPEFAKIIKYERNGIEEQTHFGIVIHMNKTGVIKKIGNDNGFKFYHRSCMKPLQASVLIDEEIDKKYNLSDEEIAICCASHTGEIMHRENVLSVLKKTGFNVEDLLLHPHEPLSKNERIRLIKENLLPDKIHNNCSGKHAAMLAICKEKNFDITDYKNINHPLSKLIINKVCELCETDINDAEISKDGCGLPVIATTPEALGKGYLNLFTDKKYDKIKQAFLNHPYLIGGKGRPDSEIINADPDKSVIAKVGACGLIVIVNTKLEECIVIKIADANQDARTAAAIAALKTLKRPDNITDRLYKIFSNEIRTQDNELIGEIIPCFSLD